MTTNKRIKVEENGKRAVFLNDPQDEFTVTQVDGCLVKGRLACDWWVAKDGVGNVLIELKGRDVSHALDQLEATLKELVNNKAIGGKVAALVVCGKPSRHPAFTAKVQRAKNRLAKQFSAPLHIVSANREYAFERVLSHTGPF